MNDWEILRLKHVASIAVSNVDKKSVDGETAVLLCNYTDVYYNESITRSLDFMRATASEDQIARFALREGDVLITKDSELPDDIGIPAYVSESFDDVVCGYHLAVIRADRTRLAPRFLYWSIVSDRVRQYFDAEATGVTRWGLRTDVISNVRLPLPALEDQNAVVAFLDAETARIDALVHRLGGDTRSASDSLCGLLFEKRFSLITAAVTGQLDISRAAA